MPHPTRIDFLDALRILTTKGKTVAPKSFSPEEAPGGYLAEAVEIVQTFPSKTGARRAARNGYALPPGIKEGEEATVAGTVPPDGHPRGEPSSLSGKAQGWRVWRVDTGAFLPEGADRVLRVSDGVIVGTDRIRVLKLPPEGSGTVKPLTGPSRRRALFDAGTRLDARLRSLAAASGISSLSVRPPFSVGFGTVGDELIDLASPVEPGPGEEHRRDVTGPWLEESIARLALVPVSLGILPDSVDPIRDAILRARDRRIAALLLLGGMGDGTTDRTLEALVRFGATLYFEGLNFEGGAGLAFAKVEGLDIFAIGGRPLEAAMVFDVLARPALLSRLGASRALWDWSRILWPLAPGIEAPRTGSSDLAWVVWPGALSPSSRGGQEVRAWEAERFCFSITGGQEGWAIFPPTASLRTSRGSEGVFYQPM